MQKSLRQVLTVLVVLIGLSSSASRGVDRPVDSKVPANGRTADYNAYFKTCMAFLNNAAKCAEGWKAYLSSRDQRNEKHAAMTDFLKWCLENNIDSWKCAQMGQGIISNSKQIQNLLYKSKTAEVKGAVVQ